MSHHFEGGMHSWMGGGMWLWSLIGLSVLILLIVVINRLPKK
jgi:uncharacterized membrane protein